MKKLFTYICTVTLVFLFTLSTFGQSLDDLLKDGDNATLKEFNNQKALEKYLAADKLSPNNWEVYWRISRAYVDIAEHMPTKTDAQEDEQLKKYQLAFDYADKSVKLASDKSITYLRRAIANGRIALFKGVFTAIGLVKDVKADCEKAIKLGNGGNDIQATAHYVLGRTHAKVCEKAYLVRVPLGLGWGDMDVAIKELKKAIELRPNYRMYHLELAKAYIEEDEFQKAKEHLYKIPNIPVADEDDNNLLSESRKLLEEIKNK
jgi:tetratricopeptide (TPR) repeat protein